MSNCESLLKTQVIKLGGTSQTKIGYETLKTQVKGKKTVVVVSAMKTITNNLIYLVENFKDLNVSEWINRNIVEPNTGLAKFLGLKNISFLDEDFNYLLLLMKGRESKLELQDEILIISMGETFTAKILNNFLIKNNLNSVYLDSINFIKSNIENTERYNKGEFNVNNKTILEKFTNNDIIVVPGFRGNDKYNNISLLGRGGSDTTGSIIAASLNSDIYQIWTDVNGIYSGDPNKINNCNIIKSISYDAAQEISAMGAKVIHPYCIKPCKEKNIPIEIRNTFDYNNNSTIIEKNKGISNKTIYSITNQSNITIFKIESLNMWNNYGFVYDIFSYFKDFNVDVNIINTSQFNITTTTDDTDINKLNNLKNKLEEKYVVEVISNCNCISIVGENIKKYDKLNEIISSILKFDIKLTSYSSNDMTLSLIVDNKISVKLANIIHNIVFPFNKFELSNNIWWKDFLYLNGPEKCKYLYSLDIIKNKVSELKELTNIDKIYYAVKANNNRNILATIIKLGLGIETVSIEEVDLIEDIIRELSINYEDVNILYTPNFSNINDYLKIFNSNLNIITILDNIDIIKSYPAIFSNKSIGIRLDLNYGFGHCNKVITQGQDSKFGITPNDLINNIKVFKDNNIRIIGLHSHMGSGITEYKHWINNLQLIKEVYDKIPKETNNVKWFDIGGGFGINNTINFKELNNEIGQIKKEISNDISIFIEPGRFVVAESGIIWGKVTQIKIKNNTKFIGTNIGMTDLIRPALYSAIHPIYFKESSKLKELVTVVGPICESGDILIKNLQVSNDININDSIVITNTGAYGIVMASNYNNRKLPVQLIV